MSGLKDYVEGSLVEFRRRTSRGLAPSARDAYVWTMRVRVVPCFHGRRIGDIGRADVKRFIDHLAHQPSRTTATPNPVGGLDDRQDPHAAQSGARRDLQYSVLPPTVLLFFVFIAVSSQASDAASEPAQVLALFPATSPLMMPLRIGAGAAAAWEIALALVLLVGVLGPLAIAAGRLYAGSVLRFGGRVALRDAWRR